MRLDEAKQILKQNGFICEDTETQDDEHNDLVRNSGVGDFKSIKKIVDLEKKHLDLEDKINKAYNFNIENLFKGVEKELIKTYKKVTMEASDYDDDNNSQLVRYYFKDDGISYCLDVMYFDEDGLIVMQIYDEDIPGIERDSFKVSTIDKAIEQIIDFVDYQLNN